MALDTGELNYQVQEGFRTSVERYYGDVAAGRVASRIALKYNVTNEELIKLHRVYNPKVFEPDYQEPTRHHVVAALGLTLADEWLRRSVGKQPYIELGGGFRNFEGPRHVCYGWCSKDEQRARLALSKESTPAGSKSVIRDLLSNRPNAKVCKRGFQNCEVAAELAVANHVYDISVHDVALGMYKHKVSVLYWAMFCPEEIVYGADGWNEDFEYGITYSGKVATMRFNDTNHVYQHDLKMWKEWCTVNAVNTKYGSVVFERMGTIGPVTLMTITRCSTPGTLASFIPSVNHKKVCVYGIQKVAVELITAARSFNPKKNCAKVMQKARKIWIPKYIHEKMMEYSLVREDRNYDRNVVASYLRCLAQNISIGLREVQPGLQFDTDVFSELATSLFLEGAVYRQVATKTIGSFIGVMKAGNDSWFYRLCNSLTVFLHTVDEKPYRFLKNRGARELASLIHAFDLHLHYQQDDVSGDNRVDPPVVDVRLFSLPVARDGHCVARTMAALEFGDQNQYHEFELPIDCTINQAVAEYPAVASRVDFNNGHASAVVSNVDFCQHGRGFARSSAESAESSNVLGVLGDCMQAADLEKPGRNVDNTVYKFAHIANYYKGPVWFACTAPGKDLECKVSKVANIRAGNKLFSSSTKNFTINKNVTCIDCVTSVNVKEVYADLGGEGELSQLAATAYASICALEGGSKRYVLKLQRFGNMLSQPFPGRDSFLSVLSTKHVFQIRGFNVSEAYVTNIIDAQWDLTSLNDVAVEFHQPLVRRESFDLMARAIVSFSCVYGTSLDFSPIDRAKCFWNVSAVVHLALDEPEIMSDFDDGTLECALALLPMLQQQVMPLPVLDEVVLPVTEDCVEPQRDEEPPAQEQEVSVAEVAVVPELEVELPLKLEVIPPVVEIQEVVNEEEEGELFADGSVCVVSDLFDHIGAPVKSRTFCGNFRNITVPDFVSHTYSMKLKSIMFRESDRQYGMFSNFYRMPFEVGGIVYPHVEGVYHSMKGSHCSDAYKAVSNPKGCLLQARKLEMRPCCDYHAIVVMAFLLHCKVEQNLGLITKVLEKGSYFENTSHGFWGHNKGAGLNYLGKLWTMLAVVYGVTINPVEVLTYNVQDVNAPGKIFCYDDRVGGIRLRQGDLGDLRENVQEYHELHPATVYSSHGVVGAVGLPWADLLRLLLEVGDVKVSTIKPTCDRCKYFECFGAVINSIEGNHVVHEPIDVQQPDIGTTRVKISHSEAVRYLKILKKELRPGQGVFGTIDSDACAVVTDLLSQKDLTVDKEVSGYTGAPGSGKTTVCMEQFNKKTTFVVAPYRRLVDEYRQGGFHGTTHIKAISRMPYSHILIDEVFALSPGVFTALLLLYDQVSVVGDPFQMRNVDEKRLYCGKLITDHFDYTKLAYLNRSFTVPIDVCYHLNKYQYSSRPFVTYCTTINSVRYHYRAPGKVDEVFCFTSRTATRATYVTVASIQGLRRRNAALFVESNARVLINQAYGQLVVALSRHSEKLDVYLATPTLQPIVGVQSIPIAGHTCGYGGSSYYHSENAKYQFASVKFSDERLVPDTSAELRAADRLGVEATKVKVVQTASLNQEVVCSLPYEAKASMEAAGVLPVDTVLDYDVYSPKERETMFVDRCEAPSNEACIAVEPYEVEEILNKIAPTTATLDSQHQAAVFTKFQANRSTLSLREYNDKVSKPLGSYLYGTSTKLPIRLRGRPCVASDRSQLLHTMLRRYSGKAVNMSPKEARIKASELFLGFKKLCKNEKPPVITEDLLSLCVAEQLSKVKDKGDLIQAGAYDLSVKASSSLIKCFLKCQTKKDLAPNSFLKADQKDIKAGQGISAQPKIVNLLVGGLVRAVEKLVKSYLLPNVKMGYGVDPEELSEVIKTMHVPKRRKAVEVDIKELDSQRGLWTDMFMDMVYEMFGVCALRMSYMTELNKNWKLCAPAIILGVNGKFQSGRADTLLSNTLVSMAFFGTYYDWKNMHLGLFQGDDVAVMADAVKQVEDKPFIKGVFTNLPSFCGYFVDNGLYIDVVSMTVKLSNRRFRDQSDLEQYRYGVRDWLRTVRTDLAKHYCLTLAKERYGITGNEALILFDFLDSFSRAKLAGTLQDKRLLTTHWHSVRI